MLRFHRAAIDLLAAPPEFSTANASLIAERELQLKRSLPASVKEWYSLARSVEVLKEYSNCDEPVPLEQLGAPVKHWYGTGPRDFLAEDLLWIMTENQGVCNWAVKLDGSDDPPVMVEVDSAPNENWQVYASSFSKFIYCQIWDHPKTGFGCSAQEKSFSEADRLFLNQQFERGPSTAAWPRSENIRFGSADGTILIWFAENHGADWMVCAPSENQLEKLLRKIWNCGNLAKTFYGNNEAVEQVLTRIRSE